MSVSPTASSTPTSGGAASLNPTEAERLAAQERYAALAVKYGVANPTKSAAEFKTLTGKKKTAYMEQVNAFQRTLDLAVAHDAAQASGSQKVGASPAARRSSASRRASVANAAAAGASATWGNQAALFGAPGPSDVCASLMALAQAGGGATFDLVVSEAQHYYGGADALLHCIALAAVRSNRDSVGAKLATVGHLPNVPAVFVRDDGSANHKAFVILGHAILNTGKFPHIADKVYGQGKTLVSYATPAEELAGKKKDKHAATMAIQRMHGSTTQVSAEIVAALEAINPAAAPVQPDKPLRY